MPGTRRSYIQVPPEPISLIQPAKQSVRSSCLLTLGKTGANQKPATDCFQGMTSILLPRIRNQRVRVEGRLTLSQLKGLTCAILDLHTQDTMPKKEVLTWKTSQKKKKKQGKLTVNSDKGYGDGSAWANHCYVNNFSHLIEYIQSNLIVTYKYSTFTSSHPRSSSINISLWIKRFIDLVKSSSGISVFLFLVLFKSQLSFMMRQRKKAAVLQISQESILDFQVFPR